MVRLTLRASMPSECFASRRCVLGTADVLRVALRGLFLAEEAAETLSNAAERGVAQ